MAIVRRSNEILRVKDDLVKHYIDIGYDVISEDGTVLQRAVPTDLTQLKAEYVKNQEQIATLKARVAELESQLAEREAPKTTRRSKKSDVEQE